MHIYPVKTSTQLLVQDYYQQNRRIMDYFDYDPFDQQTMERRFHKIKAQQYDRDTLADVLKKLNKRWNASDQTFKNISLLRDPSSVVVIGGQQAGLLSGPLYTINKLVSILVFAKQQEQALNIPVIPVFWIAGEDHDFAEMNHVMVPGQEKMMKHKLNHRVNEKKSISQLELDKEQLICWLNQLFQQLEETEYSKSLYDVLLNKIQVAHTYVDFFAQFIHEIFTETGIVLVDSGDYLLRKMESSAFQALIKQQPLISEGVYHSLQAVKQDGYAVSVDVEAQDANLFYHLHGERVLLIKQSDEVWVGKNGECRLSTDELLAIAEEHPECLSNNVVTRPVMQEWLFPTLAFIAGPGELGYWSILKPAFHALDLKMPPVVPRLSFTLLTRNMKKFSQQFAVDIEEVINGGVHHKKTSWIANQHYPPLDHLVDQVNQAIAQVHQPLREVAAKQNANLAEVANKNLEYIQTNIQYLQKEIKKDTISKQQRIIDKFDQIELLLHPNNGLQERCWNILFFMNQYGFEWLMTLLDQSYSFARPHYLVEL